MNLARFSICRSWWKMLSLWGPANSIDSRSIKRHSMGLWSRLLKILLACWHLQLRHFPLRCSVLYPNIDNLLIILNSSSFLLALSHQSIQMLLIGNRAHDLLSPVDGPLRSALIASTLQWPLFASLPLFDLKMRQLETLLCYVTVLLIERLIEGCRATCLIKLHIRGLAHLHLLVDIVKKILLLLLCQRLRRLSVVLLHLEIVNWNRRNLWSFNTLGSCNGFSYNARLLHRDIIWWVLSEWIHISFCTLGLVSSSLPSLHGVGWSSIWWTTLGSPSL